MTKRIRRRFVALFSILLALQLTDVRSGSNAQGPSQAAPRVQDEILVRFRTATPEYNKFLAHSRASAARRKRYNILEGLELLKLPPHVSVEDAIEIYKQDPDVIYAEPNYLLQLTKKHQVNLTNTPNDSRFNDLWALHNTGVNGGTPDADIDAPEAWNLTTGSDAVVVGVIDSGIDYNHTDLAANMFQNIVDCNNNGVDDDGNGYVDDCYGIDTHNNDSDPMDDNNHGTHVAGIIGAVGNNRKGVVGVNWNVRLMGCKFVNASGSGSTANAIACLEYFKIMKDLWQSSSGALGADIVATNNSWGGGGFSQALADAIDSHRQRGMLFIAAAGNGNFFGIGQNNDSNPFYPCSLYRPNLICVASTTRTDARSSFSNYGRRTVHLGAPGSDIVNTVRGNGYAALSGTSMATPHVTGTVALLKAFNPNWDWRNIKNRILAGSDSVASMDNTITRKRLNANGSLTCSNTPLFSRLRPIPDTLKGSVGAQISLAALNINCGNPVGNVFTVIVEPGSEEVTLRDDGLDPDQASGDGIYSGYWTPSAPGNYTLDFSGADEVQVSVDTPLISLTPTAQDFGQVNINNSLDRNFTVKNEGSGTLTGNATTNLPFSVVSGGSYSLGANQSQTVTIRFAPTSEGTFAGNVNFTGGDGASVNVTGVGLPPLTFTASPTTVEAGGTVTASWDGIATPTAKDWIGLYSPGAQEGSTLSLAWRYTTGTASGSVPFNIPAGLTPGTYELRLFANDGYNRLAVSNPINVTAPPPPPSPTLTANPTTVEAGGAVTASWDGISTPTAGDWIGLYSPGAQEGSTLSLAWRYTTGTASGSVPFNIPAGLTPGTYELRLFANYGYNRLAVSGPITVTAPPPPPSPTLTASPTTVGAGGSVTASWAGIAKPTAKDWIGLYSPGAQEGSTPSLAWRYTTGAASGSVPFNIPGGLTPGTYELRLFANNGYTRLAVSGPINVTAPLTASRGPTRWGRGLGWQR